MPSESFLLGMLRHACPGAERGGHPAGVRLQVVESPQVPGEGAFPCFPVLGGRPGRVSSGDDPATGRDGGSRSGVRTPGFHSLAHLRSIRATGGATGERSYYPPLSNLLDAVGSILRPKVLCVSELAQQGAGHPDLGLYASHQRQKGKVKQGQVPEHGVMEVKPAGDDAWVTAEGSQVSQYWDHYRLVLVTNTRDFVLLGEDAEGQSAKLETFRLAGSAGEFEQRLQHPRAFARGVGAAFGEYLCRALSHRARLSEPRDLAWLLASYARDGLAWVEAAGDASSLTAVRSALEEARA